MEEELVKKGLTPFFDECQQIQDNMTIYSNIQTFEWNSQLSSKQDLKRGKSIKDEKYLKFIQAHDTNIELFDQLLHNPLYETTKYPAMSPRCYFARLTSDLMLKTAVTIRHAIEDRIIDLLVRAEMKVQGSTMALDINLPYLESLSAMEEYENRIKNPRRKKQRANSLSHSISTQEELFHSIEENINLLNNEKRDKRKWRIIEGEIEMETNISCSPVAGIPAKPSEKIIQSQSALQWAFCFAKDKFFSDRFIFLKSDFCSLTFDFQNMKIILLGIRGGQQLEEIMNLDKIFYKRNYDNNGKGNKLVFHLLDIDEYNRQEEEKVS